MVLLDRRSRGKLILIGMALLSSVIVAGLSDAVGLSPPKAGAVLVPRSSINSSRNYLEVAAFFFESLCNADTPLLDLGEQLVAAFFSSDVYSPEPPCELLLFVALPPPFSS